MLVRSSSNSSASRDPQQLISQSVQHLIEQLQNGKSEALTSYLCAMSRFHKYSFGNVLLIATQRPDATRVAGYHTWNGFGRHVRKGEKGIQILAPLIRNKRTNDPDDGEERGKSIPYGFRARASARCAPEASTSVRSPRAPKPSSTPTTRWIFSCCAAAPTSCGRTHRFPAASIRR